MAAIPEKIEYTITKPDAWTVDVQYGTQNLRARLNIKTEIFETNQTDVTTRNALYWENFAPGTKMSCAEADAYRDAMSVVSTAHDNFYFLKRHAGKADGTFTFTAVRKAQNNITIIHNNEAYLVTS